ncbi:MAG: shikimate dehydrogenase [Candidatus Aminicenantes bacterium]|nr:shikimate dehydrogenase [Candidatus Aminicenantes bacterium]
MQQSHPPISGRTRLYGLFADPVGHLQTPAVLNSLLDQRGVDAVFVALHVTAEHFAATVAGMRHLRNFAGYGVSIPHKPMAARLCDELLPNARACGVVNVIRVDSDGRWIGETLDGVGMVKAITAQRALNANTRVLLVGAGGVGRAIAVALALAGVGYLAIANRTRAKADDLAHTVRRAAPACVAEAGSAFDPATFDIVINATSLGLNGQGPLPVEVSRVSGTALVAEVVMVPKLTPLLQAAQTRGLGIVRGREMLTQQVEAVADFLGMIV